MVKKEAGKGSHAKAKRVPSSEETEESGSQETAEKGSVNIPRILVENFVSLQHVLADLSTRLDGLTTQISKLLSVFEESAKTVIEKDINLGGQGSSKEVADKLNQLLDQNKIIAQGLALLHETGQEEAPQEQEANENYNSPGPQVPPQFPPLNPRSQSGANSYQRSISSEK